MGYDMIFMNSFFSVYGWGMVVFFDFVVIVCVCDFVLGIYIELFL